jgi:hypothetical protein
MIGKDNGQLGANCPGTSDWEQLKQHMHLEIFKSTRKYGVSDPTILAHIGHPHQSPASITHVNHPRQSPGEFGERTEEHKGHLVF